MGPQSGEPDQRLRRRAASRATAAARVMVVRLSDELVEFVESGLSISVGTRNGKLLPETTRAMGASVAADHTRVSVYLNREVATRTLANLADNGQIAVFFSHPVDHRSLQIKGTLIATRPGSEADRALQERYLAGFVEQLYCVMVPRAVTRRMRISPSVVVTFAAEGIPVCEAITSMRSAIASNNAPLVSLWS
jgi:hypothetical protein